MDSSDDEAVGDSMVEATPPRPNSASRTSRTPASRSPGRSSAGSSIPATPFNDGNSIVPATPAARANPTDSLTPLSGMEDDDDDDSIPNDTSNNADSNRNNGTRNEEDDDNLLSSDDEEEANNNPPPANAGANDGGANEEEQDENISFLQNGQEDLPVVRGTTINIPTAAAAFTDFLHNFISLARARRAANNDGYESDSDDSTDSNIRQQPFYMERLKLLLTQGAIHDSNQDGTISPATSSLDIDTMHLYFHSEACQKFYQQLEEFPMELVPLMDLVVRRELENLAATMATENDLDEAPHIPNVQVRPYNLRKVSNIRCLDPVAMDNLVSIKGMIVRVSPIIPDLKVAHFTCTICGNDVQVTIDRGRIKEPNGKCPRCNTSNSYQLIHNRSIFANKQLVRLQETPDEVPAGQTPASVVTFCFDDLVDSVKPGDKVEVTGVLRAQPMRVHPKVTRVKSIYKTYVDVIHFKRITGLEAIKSRDKERVGREGAGMVSRFTPERIQELREFSKRPDIYDVLVKSLAPSIWELDNVKKGVLCMLFGGNSVRVKRGYAEKRRRRDEKEARGNDSPMGDDEDEDAFDDLDLEEEKLNKRGDINILLCGDPGTSKSQLLSYVNKLSARGVYTSGKGSSAVGLTASVVRDPETRDLVLESGALVLSDQGICCIDEFDKMSDASRSVLHEAMEQQTVSIAKAGIIATLNSRTSILASANPTESRYNPSLSVVENIKLPPTLLSRFDLIYLILDSPNVDHDRRLAQHLVGLYYETPNVTEPPMDQEFLRDYIEYARSNIHPEISDDASEQLIANYLEMRNPAGGNGNNGTRTISATPRQLESLIRLSEALAKMRYSYLVTRADALEAVRLMKVATQAAATDPRTGRIDMDMITTGRSAANREMEEQITFGIKELLNERRGKRLAVRDVTRQMSEITNTHVSHDDIANALRQMEADGIIQFNERDQTLYVRAGPMQ